MSNAENKEKATGVATENAPQNSMDEELPVPTPLTPEQLEELKEKASKAEEYWDRLLRQTADFDNYKKRAAREKTEAIKFANEGLLMKLIPIVDNFEMALAAANTASTDPSVESLKKGIQMVHSLLKSTLTEAGLEEIDAANQKFDPNLHEAVSQESSADVPEGHVLKQMRKGYKFRERLLRPATVVVAKKP